MTAFYENFYPPEKVAIFREVMRGTQDLADVGRRIAAEMVGAVLPESGKQFLHTPKGLFRMSNGGNSDNSTEVGVHLQMVTSTVVMSDEEDMGDFFALHGQPRAYAAEWKRRVVEAVGA